MLFKPDMPPPAIAAVHIAAADGLRLEPRFAELADRASREANDRDAFAARVLGATKDTRREGVTVVRFPRGTVGKLRKAGFKPQAVSGSNVHCGYCRRWHIRFEEHDPCIANLPGVLGGCCGHGVERGGIRS